MKKKDILLFFICIIAVLVAVAARSNIQLSTLSLPIVKLIITFVVILLVLGVFKKAAGKLPEKVVVGVVIFVAFLFWLFNFS